MKFKTIIHGFLWGASIFIIGPIVFSYLNIRFSLPVLRFTSTMVIRISLACIALVGYIYCMVLFAKDGKGTIVPSDPPKKLIIKGPYRYTRNPIFLLHMLFYLGLAFTFSFLLLFVYFVLSIPVYHLRVRYKEEPIMVDRFGSDYENYMKKVPRWLF